MNLVKNFIGWALVLYVGFFLVWVALGYACMENGNSATECRDNTMSRVAESVYPLGLIK